ncbi:hypothetical protein ACFCXA_37405 [Streptomyces virginiae]
MIGIAGIRECRTHDPAENEAAILTHGLPYQPGVNGERRLARR